METDITPAAVEELETEATAVEEESSVEETEVSEETPEEPAEPAAPPKARGVQKRLDELTREKYEARREAEYWREMAMRQSPKGEEKSTPTERPKPTLEQYDYDQDKYVDALTDWKIEQYQKQQQALSEQMRQQEQQEKAQRSFEERRAKAVSDGVAKYGDFEEKVLSLPGHLMNQEVVMALLETDSPADVAYYLGNHLAEAERIASLPAWKKAVEIGKIEVRLAAKKVTPPSAAPPPIKPVGTSSAANLDPEKLSTAEWIRLRNEGKIK